MDHLNPEHQLRVRAQPIDSNIDEDRAAYIDALADGLTEGDLRWKEVERRRGFDLKPSYSP